MSAATSTTTTTTTTGSSSSSSSNNSGRANSNSSNNNNTPPSPLPTPTTAAAAMATEEEEGDNNIRYTPPTFREDPTSTPTKAKFRQKAPSEYFDPCQDAANRSIQCLNRNFGDRDLCSDYFQ